MNKKLLFGALAIGMLSLNSCVDDTESASVVAVRDAKTAEVQAAANLAKANAQAEAIYAQAKAAAQQAQAALDQANSDYYKAQAALENANAAYKQAEANAIAADTEAKQAQAAVNLEKAKVELERQQALLEQSKIKLDNQKGQVAAQLAQYEAQLAEWEYKAAKKQQELENLIAGKKQAEYLRLENLVRDYKGYCWNLFNLQNSLFTANKELAMFKAGLTPNTEAYANKLIAGYEEEKNNLNLQIAEKQAEIATLKSADYAQAEKDIETLKAKKATLDQALEDATSAVNAADAKQQSAENLLNKSDYMEGINGLNSNAYIRQPNTAGMPYLKVWVSLNDGSNPNDDPALFNMYCLNVTAPDKDGRLETKTTPLYSGASSESFTLKETVTVNPYPGWDNPDYMYQDVVYSESYEVYDAANYYVYNQANVEALGELAKNNVTALKDSITNYGKYIEKADASLADLKAADKKLTDAQNKLDAATAPGADATDAEKEAYEALENAVTDADKNLVDLLKKVDETYTTAASYPAAKAKLDGVVATNTTNSNIITNTYLPQAEKYSAKLAETIATLKAAGSVTKLVEELNAANEGVAKAELAEKVAQSNVNVVAGEIYACNQILLWGKTPDGKYIADEVDQLESDIADLQSSINWNQQEIDKLKDGLAENKIDDEALLAKTEANIKKLEAEIAAAQKLVDAAKAALDAALAEDAPAEK